MSGLDWTEELKKRTGIDFLTTRPMEIEKKSFEIIKGELGDEFVSSYPADALPLLCRVIHTTADFSYRDTLTITDGAVEKAKEAIRRGLPIITDTTMNQTSKMATSAIRTIKITRSPFRCQIYWSMRRKKGVQTQAARPRALAAAGATTPILMTRPARGSRETSSRRAKKTPRRIRGSRPHCRRGRWCRSVI